MANCVQIRLQEAFDYIPSYYIESDGYVYLDLDPKFDLRETKRITTLNSDDKLTFTFQIGFDLPWTEKNFAILKKFLHSNHLDNDRERIGVDVVNGSHITSQNELFIKNGKGGKIAAELKLSLNHWALRGSSLLIKDIPQDNFTFSVSDILDVIENQRLYDKANKGIWIPNIDYGSVMMDHSFTGRTFNFAFPVISLRPWYHVTSILEKGFCAIGYTFISPLFSSTYGRSLITYLIDRNYGLNSPQLNLLSAKASLGNPTNLNFSYLNGSTAVVDFVDIDNDAGSGFSDGAKFFTVNGEVDVKGRVRLKVEKKDTTIFFRFGNITQATTQGGNSFGMTPFYADGEETTSDDDQIIEWEFEAKGVPITDMDRLCISVNRRPNEGIVTLMNNEDEDGNPILTDLGSYIEYTGIRKYWDIDETINLADLIDPEWNFLDFLKGISHIFNLKWYTNFRTLEVLTLQPYEVELMGEDIEPFFLETCIEDLTAIIDPKSYFPQSPNFDSPRYRELSFKTSTDEYVKSMTLKSELYSYKADLGDKFTVEETDPVKNIFFEPTAEGKVLEDRVNRIGLAITKMHDGTKLGWNYGPRIILAHGLRRVRLDERGGVGESIPGIRLLSWNQPNRQLLAVAGHFIRYEITDTENDENASDFNLTTENIAFGINPELGSYEAVVTLYWSMYRRWFIESLNNMKLQYLVDLTNTKFRAIDFRCYYLIQHLGRTVKVRIDEIRDFHYCANILTPVDFIPEVATTDLCGLVSPTPSEDPEDPCGNFPVIICNDIGGGCYEFMIGGINVDVIQTIEWEQAPASGSPFGSIGTGLTAQVCGQSDPYYIRALVTYVDAGNACPAKYTPPKLVSPCPEINWQIVCSNYTDYQHNIIHTEGRIISNNPDIEEGDFTIISFEWSDFLGPTFNWQPYTSGTPILGEGVRLFRATVQYQDCDPFDIEVTDCSPPGIPDPPPQPNPCTLVDLSLLCVEEGSNCFSFVIQGTIPSYFTIDYIIKTRFSTDGGVTFSEWKLYNDGDIVCGDIVQGKAMIHFCDDLCPSICIESECVYEGCNNPFVAGTPTNKAFCNDGDI